MTRKIMVFNILIFKDELGRQKTLNRMVGSFPEFNLFSISS